MEESVDRNLPFPKAAAATSGYPAERMLGWQIHGLAMGKFPQKRWCPRKMRGYTPKGNFSGLTRIPYLSNLLKTAHSYSLCSSRDFTCDKQVIEVGPAEGDLMVGSDQIYLGEGRRTVEVDV